MAMTLLSGCAQDDGRTHITVWSWEPSMQLLVDRFERLNPDVDVTLVEQSDYDLLNQAIQDGYGMPDVAQVEYYALPQYAVSGQLRDITDDTVGYGSFYTPGSWSSVRLDGRTFGVPLDSGPMAFFYNDELFREAGVDASQIRTWDDYYRAARKLKDIGVCITSDSGEASFYNSMIWLSGGTPYHTSRDGKEVSITLDTDTGTREFTQFWQRMLDEGLVDTTVSTRSQSWRQAVGDGRIASMFAGAWMASVLMAEVPGGAGLWRVAQMPTKYGNYANAENGGSALGVLSSSRKPQAAMRFVDFVCHDVDSIELRVAHGAFPADNATLDSAAFRDRTTVADGRGIDIAYFGGQRYNEVFTEAASHVGTGYHYLPFDVYAQADFHATVGAAYQWVRDEADYAHDLQLYREGREDRMPEAPFPMVTLHDGILAWQADLKEYGTNQGFTVVD